jgi:hypothetical protein
MPLIHKRLFSVIYRQPTPRFPVKRGAAALDSDQTVSEPLYDLVDQWDTPAATEDPDYIRKSLIRHELAYHVNDSDLEGLYEAFKASCFFSQYALEHVRFIPYLVKFLEKTGAEGHWYRERIRDILRSLAVFANAGNNTNMAKVLEAVSPWPLSRSGHGTDGPFRTVGRAKRSLPTTQQRRRGVVFVCRVSLLGLLLQSVSLDDHVHCLKSPCK